ncbi:MAG: Uma2 family endonuclease, partial [Myxococcales bacterium]|nr:Uma2 family endonuclease [Myxococcales bacterium]
NEPDGFLVRWQSFESGRVQVAPERRSELMGAPDFAFEAVSPSSASKDLVHLREVYAAAGVSEYWIADARQDVQLTLLTLTSGAYEQVEPVDGWVASPFW